MDRGLMLGLLGLLATVIFGILSVYLVIKRKYPGQVTLVVEDCIGLFESIVKNFPELSVFYKNRPVGEGIVLLKGALVNTGSKDISIPMVEEQLSLMLPEEFKWLQTNIVATSPSVQTKLDESDQKLMFDIGLFRCNEFIRFESLAEVPIPSAENIQDIENKLFEIENKLLENLTVNHRIADTQKVSTVLLPPLEYSSRRFKFRLGMLLGCISFGIIFLVITTMKGPFAELNFYIPSEKGERIEVWLNPQLDGQVFVRGVNEKDFKRTMPAEEFFRLPGITPKIVPEPWYSIHGWLPVFIYIVAPLVLFAYYFKRHRRIQRLRLLLNISKE